MADRQQNAKRAKANNNGMHAGVRNGINRSPEQAAQQAAQHAQRMHGDAGADQKQDGRKRKRERTPLEMEYNKVIEAIKVGDNHGGFAAFKRWLAMGGRLHAGAASHALFLITGGEEWHTLLHATDDNAARRQLAHHADEIQAAMQQHDVAANEMTYTGMARAAAIRGDGDAAFNIIRDARANGAEPKLRAFHPALRSFANAPNYAKAREVDEEMAACKLDLTECEFALLLQAAAADGTHDDVASVLMRMGEELAELQPETIAIAESYFKSARAAAALTSSGGSAATHWITGRCVVNDDGTCEATGGRLKRLSLQESEWKEFLSGIESIAASRAHDQSNKFADFKSWLERRGPFHIAVDGANVALFNQNFMGGGFSWSQIWQMMSFLETEYPKKRALCFLHTNRTRNDDAQTTEAQRTMAVLREKNSLFATPKGANDDWFWMYAAVRAGEHGMLISNDEMRDHIFHLLRPKFFLRWRMHHQVKYRWTDDGLQLLRPPPYSTCVQYLEQSRSWLLPTTDGTWFYAKPSPVKADKH